MKRLLLITLALAGCPRLEETSSCTPGTYRCDNGRPYVCSPPPTRWTPASEPCEAHATVCCLTRNPISQRVIHACVPQEACIETPAADAGTQD